MLQLPSSKLYFRCMSCLSRWCWMFFYKVYDTYMVVVSWYKLIQLYYFIVQYLKQFAIKFKHLKRGNFNINICMHVFLNLVAKFSLLYNPFHSTFFVCKCYLFENCLPNAQFWRKWRIVLHYLFFMQLWMNLFYESIYNSIY